ncbi:MAG TPA: YoaK family protein [Alloacidobacterium sp.]|nr:YoaK family protein [Alloacidobacterium sp.]
MTRLVPTRRRSRRHIFLLISLLCAIAGAVDLLAYFRLGQVFVANLTGNTVLFAYHAAARHWVPAAVRLGLILAFFSGVISNRGLNRWFQSENVGLNPAVVSLGIECGLLCSLALVSAPGHLRIALLLSLAWAMGLQNDAFQKIGPVNLNTTFLTGDIEKLGITVASPANNAERRRQRRTRIAGFLTAWTAYVAGAVLGAIGNHFLELRALLIPAAMAALVIVLELTGRA